MNVTRGSEIKTSAARECDAVIIGSGPAGAAVARDLSAAGLKVVVLEEGPHVRPEEFPADAFTSMARLYRDMGASVTFGNPPMPFLQGRLVGGTSAINGAISWRLPRDIHDEWCAADPALADALPWKRLESLFEKIEEELSIAPTDPAVSGPNNDLMARGADALGLEHRAIWRNVKGCKGLGQCLQGCPEGRKMSMERTYLPDAATRGAEIICGAAAGRILAEGGRAKGVEAETSGGGKVTVKASRCVVVAAGAPQSAAMLIRNGITHGPVGRNFQAHPGTSMIGRFRENVNIWNGATQGHEVTGLRKERIKFEALGYDIAVAATRMKGVGPDFTRDISDLPHWAGWGAALRAEAKGSVRPAGETGAGVRYSLTQGDVTRLRRAVAVLGEMMLAAGAEYVMPGVHGWHEKVYDRAMMRRFAEEGPPDPKAYMMVTTHMFGTCRMGSDPAKSVVRPDFRHHAVDRLYIADSAVFPTNTGVNPQTSIIALARLCAESILR